MFCPRCGAENVDGAGYCAACGSALDPVAARAPMPWAPVYAGFWKRLGAIIIDGIILNVATTVVGLVFGLNTWARMFDPTGVAGGRAGGYSVVVVVGVWLYYSLMESSVHQATVGKMALGIVVTDLGGSRVSFGQATARYWGKILSALILMIGFLMAGFTEKKQGLHDILAQTLVVNKPHR